MSLLGGWGYFFGGGTLSMILGIAGTAFWIWMLIDCVRNDPDRGTWLWLLIFLNFAGALVYFAVRKVPAINFPTPVFIKRWLRHHELYAAEADAHNIGNAYHFLILGDILRDLGEKREAVAAYRKAIGKNPSEIQALYGAGVLELELGEMNEARELLWRVLSSDQSYDYGGASLAYGKVLYALNEKDEAKARFQKHLVKWNHPEAGFLLASILIEQGEKAEANERLKAVLNGIKGSPKYYYKKNRRWVRKARRLMRTVK
jgi:hypothetical protein